MKRWLYGVRHLVIEDASEMRAKDIQTIAMESRLLRFLVIRKFKCPVSIQHILDLFPQVGINSSEAKAIEIPSERRGRSEGIFNCFGFTDTTVDSFPVDSIRIREHASHQR